MTETRILSVVVPLYNVSVHISNLIPTLRTQDQSLIEVIFVNDGSTDNTVAVLEATLQSDPLIAPWRILNKPNGGLSDARNFGIADSELPYIAFLDPDDELSPGFYRELIDNMLATGSAISMSSSIEMWPDGRRRPSIHDPVVLEQESSSSWLWAYDWSACTKIFPRTMFDDTQFDVGIRFEDLAVVPYLMATAGRICTSDTAVYYYHRREGSITLEGNFEQEFRILDALDKIESRLCSIGKSDLVWTLLQKVLVTGFVPSVTSRYSAAQSRLFGYAVRDYIAQRRPDSVSIGLGPRAILTRMFLLAPTPSRWIITGLYRLATKSAK